ncbi:MAG: hypothetical protein ABJN40_16365 [Sneathiella sp.]
MSSFPRFLAAASILSSVFATSLQAQETAGFEKKLDKTIKAACHGYLVDAIPDALQWLREEIYKKSPFCQRVNKAYDNQDINDAIQAEFTKKSKPGNTLDLSKKHDRDLAITIECQSEYMCMESRLRFLGTGAPVNQKSYARVADFCGGRYGCIQAFFDKWPTKLPTAKEGDKSKILTFSSILKTKGENPIDQSSSERASSNSAVVGSGVKSTSNTFKSKQKASQRRNSSASGAELAAVSVGQSAKDQKSVSATDQNKASEMESKKIVFSAKRLTYAKAKAFCESKGMHLPTVPEAKAKRAQLQSGDPYWGIWTTDQTQSDRLINRYRTLRNNGFTEGAGRHTEQRTFCFP